MAVAVDGQRDAIAADRLAHDDEVARDVLLVAEGGRGHPPGRVVDRADEGQPWAAALEPVVARAVGLEEHAGLGHPVAPAAVAGCAAATRAGDPGGPEDPADAHPADDDPLALGQQLGEVAVVGAVVSTAGEGPDLLAGGLVDPARRRLTAIAVDQHRPDPPRRTAA